MVAAIRSNPECAASERMPRLPVVTPTASFNAVMAMAASTELSATPRFSKRISLALMFAAAIHPAFYACGPGRRTGTGAGRPQHTLVLAWPETLPNL